jgi:hypothetical protein
LFNADFSGGGDKNTAEIFKLEKLMIRIDQICSLVFEQATQSDTTAEEKAELQVGSFISFLKTTENSEEIYALQYENQRPPSSFKTN